MVKGAKATLRIDLNMLRGDRIVTCRDFTEPPLPFLADLEVGDWVEVVETEGDRYPAIVEEIGGERNLLVTLRLLLGKRLPRLNVDAHSTTATGHSVVYSSSTTLVA